MTEKYFFTRAWTEGTECIEGKKISRKSYIKLKHIRNNVSRTDNIRSIAYQNDNQLQNLISLFNKIIISLTWFLDFDPMYSSTEIGCSLGCKQCLLKVLFNCFFCYMELLIKLSSKIPICGFECFLLCCGHLNGFGLSNLFVYSSI